VRRRVRRLLRRHPWTWTALTAVVVAAWIAPLVYLYLASVATTPAITGGDPIPAPPFSASGWTTIVESFDLYRRLGNSVLVAGASTLIALLFGLPAAYGLSRFRLPGKRYVFLDLLILQAIPPVVAIVALFSLAKELNLLNSYWVLIILNAAFQLPFVLLVMKSFFDDIPRALDEAARLDGATWWRTLRAIALPLATPGVLTAGLFIFVFIWNEYLFAAIMVDDAHRTLPVLAGDTLAKYGVDWQAAAAASVVTTLPVLLLAIVLAPRVARGLSFGAVKG
jgi:multiple sugar transport system permease protein